jgi:hypothetical protein
MPQRTVLTSFHGIQVDVPVSAVSGVVAAAKAKEEAERAEQQRLEAERLKKAEEQRIAQEKLREQRQQVQFIALPYCDRST